MYVTAPQAILNISRSIFVISFLALGAWLLSRDSRALVLEPIERMLARVTALADNPLALQPLSRPAWREVHILYILDVLAVWLCAA